LPSASEAYGGWGSTAATPPDARNVPALASRMAGVKTWAALIAPTTSTVYVDST
jgi:hypothetical protein